MCTVPSLTHTVAVPPSGVFRLCTLLNDEQVYSQGANYQDDSTYIVSFYTPSHHPTAMW